MFIVGTEAMVAHVIKLQKVGIAMWTLVTLARVPSYVCLKIVALAKALGALITLIGTLARVCAHVDGEIIGTMKALATCVAQIRFGASVITEITIILSNHLIDNHHNINTNIKKSNLEHKTRILVSFTNLTYFIIFVP